MLMLVLLYCVYNGGLGVLAMRSPGTCKGPLPCRFSGTSRCAVHLALLVGFKWEFQVIILKHLFWIFFSSSMLVL